MVVLMNQLSKSRRIVSVFLAVVMMVLLMLPTATPVSAANRRFITELRVEAGADAIDTLEEDGWSVMMVGLNVAADPAAQVYLAYKVNTGFPITNVIVSPDVGDTYTDANGVSYFCVSHVDVNAGLDISAGGCIYATRDERAGASLVGLDVLRGNTKDDNVLYPITNDGAEIARTPEGAPADLEQGSDTDVVYLAQIRDGLIRPYISEIGVITDTDKWNAVYTACERGYNYYVEGDIDDASDTYTIIGYERTSDPEQAITGVAAVSAQTVQSLEDEQIVDDQNGQSEHVTAAAVSISGAEYVRISTQPIQGEEPYFIYRTKAKNAGNPISMLYAEKLEEKQNFLFGSWANGYFFSPGVTTAYTYSMNEDSYLTLSEDQTVCTKIPVHFLDTVTAANTSADPATPDSVESSVPGKAVRLTILTPRDGLPAAAANLTGLRDVPENIYIERTERTDRVNKYQASVFSNGGFVALITIGAVIAVAAVTIIIIRKNRPDKPKKSR